MAIKLRWSGQNNTSSSSKFKMKWSPSEESKIVEDKKTTPQEVSSILFPDKKIGTLNLGKTITGVPNNTPIKDTVPSLTDRIKAVVPESSAIGRASKSLQEGKGIVESGKEFLRGMKETFPDVVYGNATNKEKNAHWKSLQAQLEAKKSGISTTVLSDAEKILAESAKKKMADSAMTWAGAVSPIKNVSDDVVKVIAKSKDVKVIADTLKKAGVADDLVEPYAKKLVNIADEKVVKQTLDHIDEMQKATKITPTNIPKVDDIVQEAQKYKTAEEFVKAKPTYYHGTNADFETFDISKLGEFTGAEDAKLGFHFTQNKNIAQSFGKNVKEVYLDIKKPFDLWGDFVGNTKKYKELYRIMDGKKNGIDYDEFVAIMDDGLAFDNAGFKESLLTPGVIENMKRAGYDGLKLPHTAEDILQTASEGIIDVKGSEIIPFSVNQIKNKSQLTNIWNKANKTTQPLATELSQSVKSMPKAKPLSAPVSIPLEMAQKAPAKDLASYKLNVKNFNINDAEKQVITDEVEAIRPKIESVIGKKLSNQEVKKFADNTSEILNKTVGRDQTKKWEASMLNLRQKIANEAETGTVDKAFIDDLLVLKTQGSDIARKLQSLSIKADSQTVSNKQAIIDAVLKVNQNVDDILTAAKGVDFNDYKQATEFYRKFIKPTSSDWLDLLRYNSMLSSPLTHIVNVTSNLVNSAVIAPVEKTLTGSIDFIGSKVFNKPQTELTGEGLVYAKNYWKGIGDASKRFIGVMKGTKTTTNLDVKYIPPAVTGLKGKITATLSVPLKMLEGMDQFFTALSESGEKAAINYKISKGVKVGLPQQLVKDNAAYRIYRQDLFSKNQGVVLDAVDQLTSKMMSLRNNPNQIISNVAKFTVPFIKTPMNILKQGIEYSPLGVTTLYGAANKSQQLAKAMMGSAVVAGIATYIQSGRLTFKAPVTDKERNIWKSAGKQEYSIKIGDNWVSYQKLPPVFSFPMAILAGIDDMKKNKKIDDDTADMVLGAVSNWGGFFADQSYFKSMGDLLSAVRGDETSISRMLSNYPQQLIPFRALGGWMAKLIDDTQRQVDNKQKFVNKQIQLLMLNIPALGLLEPISSKAVPARMDQEGKPIPNENRVLNAFSPIKISKINKELNDFLTNYDSFKQEAKTSNQIEDKEKEKMQPLFEKVQKLKEEGNLDEAKNIVNGLTDVEYEVYKKLKASGKYQEAIKGEINLYPTVKQVQNLKAQGKIDEARKIVEGLSDEDYSFYKKAKAKLGIK